MNATMAETRAEKPTELRTLRLRGKLRGLVLSLPVLFGRASTCDDVQSDGLDGRCFPCRLCTSGRLITKPTLGSPLSLCAAVTNAVCLWANAAQSAGTRPPHSIMQDGHTRAGAASNRVYSDSAACRLAATLLCSSTTSCTSRSGPRFLAWRLRSERYQE